jgi:dipeptidyl aminopeptidase/acylaminoacyl peptidase
LSEKHKEEIMRHRAFILSGLTPLCSLLCCAADSPADREPTDPKSITAQSNPTATPVPINDLFYSRRVSSPAWSPDGKRIVFTTDMTGATTCGG